MLHKIVFLNIVLALSFLKVNAQTDAFRIQSQGQMHSIVIDSIYDESTELFIFDGVDCVDGLSVTMDVAIHSSDFLIRVLLEDVNGHQYLVAESYKALSKDNTLTLADYCEETALLNGVQPSKLKLIVHNASISMHYVSILPNAHHQRGVTEIESIVKNIRVNQVQKKVDEINSYNVAHNKLWYADSTPLALMTYDEKKKIMGFSDDGDTEGIEYYAGGIFEFGDSSSTPQRSLNDNYVDEFDWRDRHGKSWITPTQNQYTTPYCSPFAVVAGVEALTNLYYNRNIDYNLSEQEVACCADYNPDPAILTGVFLQSALSYAKDHGVMLEDDYKFSLDSLQICWSDEKTPTDIIQIGGYYLRIQSSNVSSDLIKNNLINRGPLVSHIITDDWDHAMLLVGYGQIKTGMQIRMCYPHANPTTITIDESDPRIGKTYWKFKNRVGPLYINGSENGQHDGYMYMFIDTLSIINQMYSITTPITTLHYTNDSIACEDLDGDGFYNWGIGPKPAHCPSWVPNTPDGDDSDYEKGPMDEYGYLMDIPSAIPDSIIYITQNTEWTTRKYVYHDVYVNSGKTLRITNNINFYRGTKLYLASGSTLIVDGATLTDVSINYAGTTGTSIQILHNGTIKCVDNQDFVVPLGVNLDVNYGKIN